MRNARCPGCKQYRPIVEDEDLCFQCLRDRSRQDKLAREASRDAARAPTALPLLRIETAPQDPRPPSTSFELDHPLLGTAWEASSVLRGTSSTARHQLLSEVRKALHESDPGAALGRLEARLAEREDPSPLAGAALLRTARSACGTPDRIVDFIQACVGFTEFRDVFRAELPTALPVPLEHDGIAARWFLDEAWAVSERLGSLDATPVRQLMTYLRALDADAREVGWRAALFLSLEAAAAARAVKGYRASPEARIELLSLVRWGVEAALAQPANLRRQVIPAIEAVVACHSYRGEKRRFERRHPGAPSVPDGYLSSEQFDGPSPPARLFNEDARAIAVQLATDDVSTAQVRRFFHDIRRFEHQVRSRPWEQVRPRLFALLPLAADAVARCMKVGRDLRALGLLVEKNVRAIDHLGIERQRDAFLTRFVPHLEAVLAHFVARTLGAPPRAEGLPAARAELLDDRARKVAADLLYGGISASLLRTAYTAARRLEHLDQGGLPAGVERLIALTDESLRRSQATPDGRQKFRALTREARGLTAKSITGNYLPYFESVLAWFVGLQGLSLESIGSKT